MNTYPCGSCFCATLKAIVELTRCWSSPYLRLDHPAHLRASPATRRARPLCVSRPGHPGRARCSSPAVDHVPNRGRDSTSPLAVNTRTASRMAVRLVPNSLAVAPSKVITSPGPRLPWTILRPSACTTGASSELQICSDMLRRSIRSNGGSAWYSHLHLSTKGGGSLTRLRTSY
jgi:hypothetical protein